MPTGKRSYLRLLYSLSVVLSSAGGVTDAAEIIVDASGGGDYPDIWLAIRDAVDGDVIIVRPGVYRGFQAWNRRLTIRSVAPENPATVDATIVDRARFDMRDGSHFEIAGLTIRGATFPSGGGITVANSFLILRHCALINNWAFDGYGGGIDYIRSSYVHFGNRFIGNRASGLPGRGSAVYAEDSHGVVERDAFIGNTSSTVEGWEYSLFADGGSIIVRDSVFEGEGVLGDDVDSMEVRSSIFRNSPWSSISHTGPTPHLVANCAIIGNGQHGGIGTGQGGAIVIGNTVCGCLTAMAMTEGHTIFRNNLFFDNKDGVIRTSYPGSSVDIEFNVFANLNQDLYKYAVGPFYPPNNYFQVDPGVVQRGTWDDRGTPDDPLDDIYTPGDIHLAPGSICIDAGDPEWNFDPLDRDLDGRVRVAGGRPDIGADEFPALGDLTGDGQVTLADLDAFVLALTDRAAHHAAYPQAEPDLAGDCNADGRFDNFDIGAFRARLPADEEP
ncbi:MAG: right-handed parallel beta-helix repeat-containing protein [Phycisphaerae bacterium]